MTPLTRADRAIKPTASFVLNDRSQHEPGTSVSPPSGVCLSGGFVVTLLPQRPVEVVDMIPGALTAAVNQLAASTAAGRGA